MMKIFLTGQASVHWGRKEFGNIGNYYVTTGMIREIKRAIPNCDIRTTLQLSDEFCQREGIKCQDLSLYYAWSDADLPQAIKEYGIAKFFSQYGFLIEETPYIKEVLNCDLFIEHSGDMWGENADLAGKNRFLVGLLKDRVAQLLGKKCVMLGASPGPFPANLLPLALETLNGFDLITTRESSSKKILEDIGLDISNVREYACPSFNFVPFCTTSDALALSHELRMETDRLKVGFVLCGWNMESSPFSKWPRDDSEYLKFVDLLHYCTEELALEVYLMSHSNGFVLEPEFRLQRGRDFPIVEQLYNIAQKQQFSSHLHLLTGLYTADQTKALIGNFDLFISGRLHAAAAALNQEIPTTIIDYGHEPKAHKLKGLCEQLEILDLLINPVDLLDMKRGVSLMVEKREEYHTHLKKIIPTIKKKASDGFDCLQEFCYLKSIQS